MPWQPLPDRDGGGDQPVPVAKLVDQVLAGLGAPSVDTIVLVHERWAEIVGDELVAHAQPLAIEGGRLRIGVDSPAWASHFRWAEAEILARLERLLGAGTVTAITARVARS